TDLDTSGVPQQFPIQNERLKTTKIDDFKKIPGSPIAYWVSDKVRDVFDFGVFVQEYAVPRQGFATGRNDRFLRYWHEINFHFSSISCFYAHQGFKWYPCNKGGTFRKWYGNNNYVVNWGNDGSEMKEFSGSVIRNPSYDFKKGTTWSTISSSSLSMRFSPAGFLFETKGSVCFPDSDAKLNLVLALMNSKVVSELLLAISPTLDFHEGPIGKIPVLPELEMQVQISVEKMVEISKLDWDSYETSWDFTENPIIRTQQPNLEQSFNTWQQQNTAAVAEMKQLEEENNKLFIDAYGLQDELTPDVPDEQITLTRADREKDSQRLVSYVIACMMGRYSLDELGLIYAHAANEDFDLSRYKKFPADVDGIIPLTQEHWFENDAATRIKEFLGTVWTKESLEDNMRWLSDSLGSKVGETPEESIRRYLATKFYKDHMRTYQKRPIYWLFSSGKLGAFQALVYLHRYNESTLARMRTEYVMPLMSKMAAYVKSLETSKENSDSAAEIKRIEKKIQDLEKQQAELSIFEEKLRHYADQRISLDLDDGVRVNYGKFGDLLANAKDIAAKGKD
ncbi:BREX-1 system adenine-specific DNA-methyltransferase PglX, partial [bacterium]|nr:BREX-1 system adenine-specific DNA-methyltransferase PglX [bacterium]